MESPGCTHTLNDSSVMEKPFVKRKGLPLDGSLLVYPKKILLHLVIDTHSLAPHDSERASVRRDFEQSCSLTNSSLTCNAKIT